MTAKTNKTNGRILAQRAIGRAESGLYFLGEILNGESGETDIACSRSLYILFSYNFELILSSLVCLDNSEEAGSSVIQKLKCIRPQHDYGELSKLISKESLKKVGITSVTREGRDFIEYHVKLLDKSIIKIQDLVDVRYDFKKDTRRNINPHEMSDMKDTLEKLLKITPLISGLAWD